MLRHGLVNSLLVQHSIDIIENSLVTCFVEKHNLHTKNQLIRRILKKTKKSNKAKIKRWLIDNEIDLNLMNIERMFELLIEEKDRKLNGAFYTPKFIVDYIIDKTITAKTRNVCDCSCGSGSFLTVATKRLSSTMHKSISYVIENCVYGVDILERNIYHTKIMLTLLMLVNGDDKENLSFNLKVADSLNLDWKSHFPEITQKNGFDAVVGNPPYVRAKNLPDELKKSLHMSTKWETAPTGKADLFIPFVELGVNLINNNGVLGYVIPNTFFTSIASKELRKFLQNRKLLKEIIDFDHLQVFQDVTIYTCISIIDKKPKSHFNYILIKDKEEVYDIGNLRQQDFIKINFEQLDHTKWVLLDKDDMDNIIKLETCGESLKSVCTIKTGISTLKNHLYVINDGKLNRGYYAKSYRNKMYLIEKHITREVLKSGKVKNQQYIKNNTMRIIYPYYKDKYNKMKIIPEKILKKKHPNCYDYFLAIKSELKERDKGKKEYERWYAYGRSQGLENDHGPKLIMPDMSYKPRFVLCKKDNVLFFTGYALWLNNGKPINLHILSKILTSKIFAYYMNKTSRRYQNGYRSYAKHFIENFSIPEFTDNELRTLESKSNVDGLLIKKYGLQI